MYFIFIKNEICTTRSIDRPFAVGLVVCPEGTYKIALVYYCESTEGIEHTGFHWYRQNPDGTWSHKSGQMPISSMDYGDCEGIRHVITDPLVCNRVCRDDDECFDYNMFGGYYAVSSWDGIYMP